MQGLRCWELQGWKVQTSSHYLRGAQACIHSVDEALQCCKRIGYPIMLKASWGGGGKGIRKVPPVPCGTPSAALPVAPSCGPCSRCSLATVPG